MSMLRTLVLLCTVLSFFLVLGKRRLDALLWFSPCCCVAIGILFLFIAVPSVGLQCVVVAFPGHTNLLFILKDM